MFSEKISLKLFDVFKPGNLAILLSLTLVNGCQSIEHKPNSDLGQCKITELNPEKLNKTGVTEVIFTPNQKEIIKACLENLLEKVAEEFSKGIKDSGEKFDFVVNYYDKYTDTPGDQIPPASVQTALGLELGFTQNSMTTKASYLLTQIIYDLLVYDEHHVRESLSQGKYSLNINQTKPSNSLAFVILYRALTHLNDDKGLKIIRELKEDILNYLELQPLPKAPEKRLDVHTA